MELVCVMQAMTRLRQSYIIRIGGARSLLLFLLVQHARLDMLPSIIIIMVIIIIGNALVVFLDSTNMTIYARPARQEQLPQPMTPPHAMSVPLAITVQVALLLVKYVLQVRAP